MTSAMCCTIEAANDVVETTLRTTISYSSDMTLKCHILQENKFRSSSSGSNIYFKKKSPYSLIIFVR